MVALARKVADEPTSLPRIKTCLAWKLVCDSYQLSASLKRERLLFDRLFARKEMQLVLGNV